MKETINAFLESKTIAIAGASPNAGNFGLSLMKELKKSGYSPIPVNPNYEEVEGEKCYATVSDLPPEVENIILVTNPERAFEIASQVPGTAVKRVWLQQGVGKGAFSEKTIEFLKENNLEYVYGFCPLMFFGKGMHKFHFWMRKNLGKTPVEFSKN